MPAGPDEETATSGPGAVLTTAARRLADLVFPRSCVHCGGAVEDSPLPHLCRTCDRALVPALPPACRTCGHPFFGLLAGPRQCPHCSELDPWFESGVTLFLMRGPGRSLLHELKYHAGFYVLEDLGNLLDSHRRALDQVGGATLVPVPLHPVKARERGFNQSRRLADCFARVAAGAVVEEVLVRVRATGSQTRLRRDARAANVKNAFALKPGVVIKPDKSYVLVDDVFTTGATLNACARVLSRAGAGKVRVITAGHG